MLPLSKGILQSREVIFTPWSSPTVSVVIICAKQGEMLPRQSAIAAASIAMFVLMCVPFKLFNGDLFFSFQAGDHVGYDEPVCARSIIIGEVEWISFGLSGIDNSISFRPCILLFCAGREDLDEQCAPVGDCAQIKFCGGTKF